MAISLPTVPTTSPGVAPTSSLNSAYVALYKVLTDAGLSGNQIKAVNAEIIINQIAITDNTDYRTNHAQLVTDALLLTKGLSMPDPNILRIALAYGTSTAGGPPNAPINTLDSIISKTADLAQLGEDTLNRIIALLEFRLVNGG